MKQQFSLFRLERQYHKGLSYVGEFNSIITESCFEFVESFDTLEEAQLVQKGYKLKTKIIPTY